LLSQESAWHFFLWLGLKAWLLMRNNQSSVKPNVFSIDYHLVHDGVSTEADLCANELNSLICLYRLIIKIGDLT
jgi:hypothetical protein